MMFKLTYLDNAEQQGNGFADFGTLCHELLEGWAKGDIPIFALAEEYENRFDSVVTSPFPPFPKGLPQKYYEQGLEYFDPFDGFGEDYEILEVEDKFVIDIEGYTFVGIADFILRNKTTGEIEVVDHKSKSMATMKKDLPTYRKQLYVYAHHVKQKYGVFPSKLKFNIFRENDWVVEDFNEDMYHETLQWIVDTIHRIEKEPDWNVSTSSFFCRYICSVIDSCPARDAVLYAPKKKKEEK